MSADDEIIRLVNASQSEKYIPDALLPRLRAELRRRYETGETIHALSAAIGRSYYTTRNVLTESGVTMRLPGRGGVVADNHALRERAAALISQPGATYRSVAAALGVQSSTVFRWTHAQRS
ncbi:helix-turn-helix domain-containing protein [Actinokineospora sp. NBRC 105648]|uniref:helix-turn-helix domain-containing protein n=1 Tax=Actinokineospora sp. NBRC 105648 TaxID=3032206 RepID=UPI0024A2B725|nr:helix-turn-helix domain-containing protein [Actinokineospora sp. NBRC 105648]GLZ39284.1 hypothetical protein Acsp05_29080 [Actinokineospora sp. NBRC 105648]